MSPSPPSPHLPKKIMQMMLSFDFLALIFIRAYFFMTRKVLMSHHQYMKNQF